MACHEPPRNSGASEGSVCATVTRPLVIGIGNAYRRDDAVGLVIARHLLREASNTFEVREENGEGASLLEAWGQSNNVILVDATHSGAVPGTVVRLDAGVTPVPIRYFRYSTHAFGVAEAIELARSLGRLPRRLVVFGVEGNDFTAGEGLSAEVAASVPGLLEAVTAEAQALGRCDFEPPCG